MLRNTLAYGLRTLTHMRMFTQSSARLALKDAQNPIENEPVSNPQNPQHRLNNHTAFLRKYYNPALLQSIEIAESVVDPHALWKHQSSANRTRSMVPPSNPASDYSTTDPKWEEPIVYPNQGKDHTPYPAIPDRHGTDEKGLTLRFRKQEDPSARRSTGVLGRRELALGLSKLTGLDPRYISNLYVRPIVMKRVSLKTSKGNIPNFFVMTIVGDRKGTIGLGIGKSRDGIRVAAVKAHWNAVKNLTPIPRYEDRTIVGDIDYKYHAVKLYMRSAPAGFGLRVNPNIFEVCQAAGIKDMRGKVYKSRNPVLVVKGFIEALTKQQLIDDLAAGRGKKIMDLRSVYYSS